MSSKTCHHHHCEPYKLDVNLCKPLVRIFDRLIVQTTDKSDVTNNPENIIDPNHAKMLDSGLYDAAEILQMQADSLAYFITHFGFDFSTGTLQLDGTTQLVIPGGIAVLIPYATGLDKVHKLAFDSKHPKRGQSGKWYFEAYGNLVLILATGTFASGTATGQTYSPNNILFYFDQNALKKHHREIFQIRSFAPSQTMTNSFGKSEQHTKFHVIDKCENVGYGTLEIVVDQDVNDVLIFNQKNRGVYTWDC